MASSARREAGPRRIHSLFVNLSDTARHVGEAYTCRCVRGGRRAAMIRLFKHYVPYAVLLLGAIDFVLLMLAAEAGWTLAAVAARAATFDPDARAAAQHARLRRHAAGGDGRGRRLWRRGAAIGALRDRPAAGRGGARHHPPLAWSSSSSRRSASGARACSTRSGSASSRMVAGADRARATCSAASGSSAASWCSAPGARAARIEALAQRARRRLRGGRLRRHERRRRARSPARSTAPTSPACPIICSGSAPARSCWRSRSGATRCRSTTCSGSRPPASQVHDFSSFLERETGRVDLDSLNPSWLIFSDGFSAGRRLSSVGKRLFDVAVSLAAARR